MSHFKKNKMIKTIENNLAEMIIIGVFLMVFLSSCGIQFGNYERWKEVHNSDLCKNEISQEDIYTSNDNCENCDEVD